MVIYRYLDPYTYIIQLLLVINMNHIGEPGSVVYGVPATHRYNVEKYAVRQETWINQAAK